MSEVYLCSDYLKSHPLFRTYGTDLATLAKKDYPSKDYFGGKDILSIDLDEFERNTNRSNDCTCDAVIGIADVSHASLTNQRLLLTELRMNYENPKNLDFSNIKRKFIHSSEILREYDSEKRVDSNFALVFSTKTAPKARRWISNWAKESSKKEAANWKAYAPESFCNYINYGKPLPLLPSEETVAFVRALYGNSEIGYDKFSQIKDGIESYWWKIKGKCLSVDMDYFSKEIRAYLSSLGFPEGEEGILCKLLKEDIEEILL